MCFGPPGDAFVVNPTVFDPGVDKMKNKKKKEKKIKFISHNYF